jgi:hypothetical protein
MSLGTICSKSTSWRVIYLFTHFAIVNITLINQSNSRSVDKILHQIISSFPEVDQFMRIQFSCAFPIGQSVLKRNLISSSRSNRIRWPIRVIHAQKVKSPHNIRKHANKCAIHATISRFTPQFHGLVWS